MTTSTFSSNWVRLSRAAEQAVDQLVLDDLGGDVRADARTASLLAGDRLAGNVTAVVERLEARQLMAGDASIVQAIPYSLGFDSTAGGFADKDGEGTGFTWVQTNKLGNEYQPSLIDLDTGAGRLRLTTTGNATAGGPWETDNTLVNAVQTQFNASTGKFTITTRLVGPLGYLNAASQQGGIIFGPDQDNYVKLVATASPNGQFLQFIDEQKPGATFVHQIPSANSYTGIGSFANIQTLDLMLAGDAATGTITAFYRVNGGAINQLAQTLTLTGGQRSAFFSSAARAGLMVMAKNNLAPVTVAFDRFEITSGTPAVSRPSVNSGATTPLAGATGVQRDSFVSVAVTLPNVGQGVNPASLSTSTVLLYRTGDRRLVAGHVSTSGAGDTITFKPNAALDANTSYTFEVTSGVTDTGGSQFLPFKMTFTTGTKVTTANPNIAFEQVNLPSAAGRQYTGLTMGPDGRLYAATFDGLIQRFTIRADGTLSAPQNITTVANTEANGRTITGIVFDPSSTANNLVLWVTHGQHKETDATDWTGKISRLTGANLENYQDYIVGLPRSVRDHLTNQAVFGPDGALYFCQASNSAMGAPDAAWGQRPERLLTAAILRLDVGRVAQRLAAGQGALDVRTEGNPSGNYNPFAAGAPLTIYASGVRNAYDLVWTRSGHLYAPTNGSAAGGATPSWGGGVFGGQRIDGRTWSTPVQGIPNVSQTENDYLFRVTPGGYYGHPNPLRGEFVRDGGNPTTGTDYEEFTQYPVGTAADPNYQGAAYIFGKNFSPNGVIEYQGNAFGGALDGKLMVVRYSGGADVMVLTPDANGNITDAQAGFAGLTGFINPVDIVQDRNTGFVYIADYGAQKIVLCRTVTPGARIGVNKPVMYFSDDYAGSNTTPGKTQILRIHNNGTSPLSIPASGLVLSNTTNWVITKQPTLPASIPVGGYVEVGLAFRATSAAGAGVKTATLSITSNDVNNPAITVDLRGLAAAGTGGQLEQSLQRILQLYNLGTNTGDANVGTTNLYSPSEPLSATNDEVYVQRLVKAGGGPVTIEALGSFAGGSPVLRFGYYKPGQAGNRTQLFTIGSADAQTVDPTLVGSTSFDPGSAAFGLYANFPIFNNVAFSEDALNTKETTVANRRKVRFYQLRDADGSIVPNAYVFAAEDFVNDGTGGYDTNDFVGIIRNVKAADLGPSLGLENLDGIPYPDRLVFNRIQIQPPDVRKEYNPITGKYDIEVQPPNNVVHDTARLRLRNTGTQPMTINSLVLSNTAGWQVVDPPAAGTQVAPGEFIDITVRFIAQTQRPGHSGNETIDLTGRNAYGGSAWNGTLTINTNDVLSPSTVVQLAGWWQYKSEANMEPNLPTIVNKLYGWQTKILGQGQQFGSGTLAGQTAAAGEETISPYWVRADSNVPVTVRQLTALHTQGNKATIRWYSKAGAANALFAHTGEDGQSFLPRADTAGNPAAQASFNPSTAFQFWVDGEFGNDAMNKPVATQPQDTGHHMRFWAARDRNGNVIPNTWIMGMDYQGINYDYQDNVYLITNMRPENPSAPTGLAAAASGPGIGLTWTASGSLSVTGYHVYRSTSATGTFERVNGAPVTGTSYLDVDTVSGQTYYYKVSAVDDFGGESAQSAAVSGSRVADTDPPARPNGLGAANGTSGIVLTWTASGDADLAGYRLYRSDSATGTFVALNNGAAVTGTTFTDVTAGLNQTWFYRITAVDLSGNESVQSEPASATRQDTTPPAVPNNLTATNGAGGITVGWSASADADTAGYRVYRSNSANGTYEAMNAGQLVTAASFTDASVAVGQTWYYRVTAVDTAGNESALSATVAGTRPAPTQTAVRINVGGGAYTDANGVQWAADAGFTGGTASTLAYDVLGTTDDPLFFNRRWGNMTYNVNVPDGQYTLRLYFADPLYTTAGKRVFDVRANGSTILSNFDVAAQGGGKTALAKTFTVNVTGGKLTLNFVAKIENPILSAIEVLSLNQGQPGDTTPPAVPTGLTAAGSASGVALSWAANTDADLAGYNLFRATSANGTYVKVNSALLTGTTFNDTGAPAGVTSHYRLVAVDASGNASEPATASATVTAPADTTPPARPAGLTVASATTMGIKLTWSANTESDLAGYLVYRASTPNGTFVKITASALTSPTFYDTTATKGVTSYYRIVAVDKAGNASPPASISAVRPV